LIQPALLPVLFVLVLQFFLTYFYSSSINSSTLLALCNFAYDIFDFGLVAALVAVLEPTNLDACLEGFTLGADAGL